MKLRRIDECVAKSLNSHVLVWPHQLDVVVSKSYADSYLIHNIRTETKVDQYR